jgi:hypothetical protein
MAKDYKTLNIKSERHSQLRLEAARQGIPIYQLVDKLLKIGLELNLYECDLSTLKQVKDNPE